MANKPLILGIDIDTVLTDDDDGERNYWLEAAGNFFGKAVTNNAFHIHEALGISKERAEKFLLEEAEHFLNNVPSRPYCQHFLTKVSESNHKIFLITSRRVKYKKLTEDWLQKHSIPYDGLYMRDGSEALYSKGEICRKLGVQFFVDDNFRNCVDVAREKIYTLMFHATHNREVKTKIPRVYHWHQIEEHFEEFSKSYHKGSV